MANYGPLYQLRVYYNLLIILIGEFGTNLLHNLRVYSVREKAHLPASLEGKVVVITGANTGIGKETAQAVAQRGAQVYLACRDRTRASQAIDSIVAELGGDENKRAHLHFVELNLSSLDSVRACAAELNKQVGPHIDVLINNAGVMGTPEWKTEDGYEFQFGTNHLGHFLLTQLLIDKLRAAPGGARVVNVSAALYVLGKMHWDNLNLADGAYRPLLSYCRSKLANNLFTKTMAQKLQASGSKVKTYCLHPGVIRTELGRHQPNSPGPNSLFARFFTISQQEGAETTLYCAFDREVEHQTGLYYDNCKQVELMPHGRDEAAGQRLWDLSLKLVDVHDRI